MKRQAEEMECDSESMENPGSPSSGTVKLDKILGTERVTKKRTLDQIIFNLNGAKSPERPSTPPEEHVFRTPTPPDSNPSNSPKKLDTSLEQDEFAQDKTPIPSINGVKPFPCVWLGEGSPQRPADNSEIIPNPVLSRVADVAQEVTPSDNSDNDTESAAEVCPQCNKVFKRKVYLQRHMEREHWSTAKVFKCDDCSYETKHQSNLSVHRRIHTGERPYHCGACGQRYTQGHLLKSHIRSRHNGNMEFYNLDKKSDSTRGRKSLDLKRDLGSAYRSTNEKINSLLQQANMSSPTSTKTSLGNSLFPPHMSPLMNSMNYVNSLRPLMAANPFGISPSMLSPRMLPFAQAAGLPNGFQHGNPMLPMPGTFPFLGAQGMMPTLDVSDSGEKKEGEATKSESPAAKTDASQSNPTTGDAPQDLSLKKEEGDEKSDEDKPAAKPDDFIKMNGSHKRVHTPESDQNDEGVVLCNGKGCEDLTCPHAFKLKELRKNIVRMLSVLTPDILNIESGLDYTTDQVDQLLHEVIYSNDDERKT